MIFSFAQMPTQKMATKQVELKSTILQKKHPSAIQSIAGTLGII